MTVRSSTHAQPQGGSNAVERSSRHQDEQVRGLFHLVGRWADEHPAVIVLVLALAAGVWAVAGSHHVFRYLSDDHDEGLYLLQAKALARGYVLPPAPNPPEAFIPWLSVLRDGRFVLKYAPVHASILALGVRVLGSPRWSLGLIAGALVGVTYLLAKEVLGDRRLAVLASVFLALSPLFLIQSATFLPYCSSLLLLEGFAFTLLRGVRTKRAWVLAVSGFLFGLALFARPFDALLFGLPLGVYFVLRQRQGAQLRRSAGWFGLGIVLPLAATLLYYRAATGSPFRPPFNLLEPSDTIGFGPRRLLPGQPALPFTPSLGWYGVSRHVLLTSFWGFGGLLLVGFFLVGLLRRRRGGPEAWIVLAAIVYTCGYGFFWGTYGTGLRGSLTSFLGPFYFLPVLACVTLLAAKGFGELWRRDRLMTLLAVGGMVMVSGYLVTAAFKVNLRLTEEDRRLYSSVETASLGRAVVFLPPMWGPHLLHPFNWLQNDPDYDGETVYALDRGDPANLALLGEYPGRAAYRLHVHGHYRANPPDPAFTSSLEPLTVLDLDSLGMDFAFENPTTDPYVSLEVSVDGRTDTFVLDTESHQGKSYQRTARIRADGAVELSGPLEAHTRQQAEGDGLIRVSISTTPADAATSHTLYRRQLAYAVEAPRLKVLLPGAIPVNELGTDPVTVGGS